MYAEELSSTREWDDFINSIPSGTFYHSLKWKEVIERSFPCRALYLVVRSNDGRIAGVSPGFITESLHTRIYDSTPHSDYGGPLFVTSHLHDASYALLDFLRSVSSSKGLAYAKFLVIEKALENHLRSRIGCAESNVGVMEVRLATTPSRFIWRNIFSSNRRKKFKQMERRGFQARQACTKSDLRIFYDLYLKNMMHLGVRARPYSFFENAWNTLHPSNVRIWILENREPLAVKLFFQFGGKSFSAFVGLERDRLRGSSHATNPVDYLSWTEIRKAEEEGLSCVSLGTTLNDPRSPYFVQKTSMGCTFYPQSMIWAPLCLSGQVLVRMRSASVHAWRAIRPSLPSHLTQILEGKLDTL